MNTQDFVTKPVRGIFFRYLIPSICGTMVTSIYVLADTIMIGKGLGATAMAALNIALPIYNIFFGIGLLFGVGGSVLMSVCRGRGDKKTADAFFTLSFILNIVIWLLSQIVCVVWMEEIAWALGATKETFPYVMDYMRCIIWGMGAYYLSSYLQTFVRNDGAPKLAMNAVIAGGVTNIVLDYLFVFPMQMGMEGAALATVLGSTLTVVILVLHFFSPKNQLRFQIHGMSISAVREILVNGAASFVIMSLCKGVNQAAQPIISTNFGAGKGERIHQVFWSAVWTSLVICAVPVVVGIAFPDLYTYIFLNPDPQILALSASAIRIYFVGFIAMAVNMVFISYFQAVVKPVESLIICMLRGCVLLIALVYLLPLFLGVIGIWLAFPAAEVLTMLMGIGMFRRQKTRKAI